MSMIMIRQILFGSLIDLFTPFEPCRSCQRRRIAWLQGLMVPSLACSLMAEFTVKDLGVFDAVIGLLLSGVYSLQESSIARIHKTKYKDQAAILFLSALASRIWPRVSLQRGVCAEYEDIAYSKANLISVADKESSTCSTMTTMHALEMRCCSN